MYRRLRRKSPARTLPVCYYRYALQGALDGLAWDAISPAVKKRLREQAGAPDRRIHERRRWNGAGGTTG